MALPVTDAPDAPDASDAPDAPSAQEQTRATWAARFGWLAGGILGVVLGFALTWVVETRLLTGRADEPARMAARLSSVLVPAVFLMGALLGEAFGRRGGAGRYRLLGAASGVFLAVAAWLAMALSR